MILTNNINGTKNQVVYLEYISSKTSTSLPLKDILKIIELFDLDTFWIKISKKDRVGYLCLASLKKEKIKKIYENSFSINKFSYFRKSFVEINFDEQDVPIVLRPEKNRNIPLSRFHLEIFNKFLVNKIRINPI